MDDENLEVIGHDEEYWSARISVDNQMLDVDKDDEICSNCKNWDGKHRFDLKGFCNEHLVPMRFLDNCKSAKLKNKFKKRKIK